jgi:hypothetical protein
MHSWHSRTSSAAAGSPQTKDNFCTKIRRIVTHAPRDHPRAALLYIWGNCGIWLCWSGSLVRGLRSRHRAPLGHRVRNGIWLRSSSASASFSCAPASVVILDNQGDMVVAGGRSGPCNHLCTGSRTSCHTWYNQLDPVTGLSIWGKSDRSLDPWVYRVRWKATLLAPFSRALSRGLARVTKLVAYPINQRPEKRPNHRPRCLGLDLLYLV